MCRRWRVGHRKCCVGVEQVLFDDGPSSSSFDRRGPERHVQRGVCAQCGGIVPSDDNVQHEWFEFDNEPGFIRRWDHDCLHEARVRSDEDLDLGRDDPCRLERQGDAPRRRALAEGHHPAAGGIRVSAYNAVSVENIRTLVTFMESFAKARG